MRKCTTRWGLATAMAIASLCVGNGLASARDASDTDAEGTGASAPEACDSSHLRLEGAATAVKPGLDVAYVEAWTASLTEVARCIGAPGSARACVRVTGFADDVAFAPEVVQALGSIGAAQRARARARALTVISKLVELGVPPRALREGPPTVNATFRGVEVDIVAECEPKPRDLPTWVEDPEELTRLLQGRGFVRGGQATPALAPSERSSPTRDVAERPSSLGLWLAARVGETYPWGKLYGQSAGLTRSVDFHDVASTGVSSELDAGLRLGRSFVAFGFWERLWLGQPGSGDFQHYAGGQQRQTVDSLGLALRGVTAPSFAPGIEIAAELGLAYRVLSVAWGDGSSLSLVSPAVLRAGAGVEFPLTGAFSVSTLLLASAGVFTRRELSLQGGESADFAASGGVHGTLGLHVAGHFEILFPGHRAHQSARR